MTMTRIMAGACMLAMLAACSSEDTPPLSDDDREAAGEVLGGSISDDMIPLASVRSQSPTLAQEDGARGGNDESRADDAEYGPDDAASDDEPQTFDGAFSNLEPAADVPDEDE